MSILVILEQAGGAWHRMGWETLAAGQELGAALGVAVSAAVIGEAREAATKKLDRVYTLASVDYTADAYTAAYEQLIRHLNPKIVLFPHTYLVRDFAPKLATRFGRAMASDVIKCRVENGGLVLVRQLFQGKLNMDLRLTGDGPQFISLQAGSYRAEALQDGTAQVEPFTANVSSDVARQKPEAPFREAARAVDLTTAELIVSVGRGIKEKENIHIVEELAQVMGAELAASRPIIDSGWLAMERQVGSSGQTVSPKVYMAVGISGAIQHLVGMKGAKCIVAINKDANAPIFEVADYGIVGDLFEVVPALIEEIKKAKA